MKCSKRKQKQGPANNSRDITDMRTRPVMQIIHATTIDMAFFFIIIIL